MSQPSQADILAALSAQTSSRKRQPPKTSSFSSFTNPETELTTSTTTSSSTQRTNSRRIYCPREGCNSLILLPKAGTWIIKPSNIIPTESSSPFPPSTSQTSPYWHIHGSPMTFENIGFSRPSDMKLNLPDTEGTNGNGAGKVKFLICAECDLGPIGWGFEGGDEAWVAVERVKYGDAV